MFKRNQLLHFLVLLSATLCLIAFYEPAQEVTATSSATQNDVYNAGLADRLQALREERRAIEGFLQANTLNPRQVELGQALFFDKVISGNRNISCATCHHTLAALGDGLSLPVGEGGQGLGITRNTGVKRDKITHRVPRNAPHVFNLGLVDFGYFPDMFWDGRVAVDDSKANGFVNPQGENLPSGFSSQLAVQAVFPITSNDEMAGGLGENNQGTQAAMGNIAGPNGVWEIVVNRLKQHPEYVKMFRNAFADVTTADDITIVHMGEAIAAFEKELGDALDSPFDRYLLGDTTAMSVNARHGMRIFYGKGRCYECHSGALQTDNSYRAIAMPQIGPGKGDGSDGLEDFGRERVTKNENDRYRFRVPSLRQIALTGPYGHDGAFDSLEDVVNHHIRPLASLENYNPEEMSVLPSRKDLDRIDFEVHETRRDLLAAANELPDIELTAEERKALIDFLHALTDYGAIDLRRFTPLSVPSGLPVLD